MKQESKDKLKSNAPSLGAVVIALATMVGGISECNKGRADAKKSEKFRVNADKAIVAQIDALEEIARKRDQQVKELKAALKGHDDEIKTLEKARIKLEIRVGVLQRSVPNGDMDHSALLDELWRLAEEEGVDEVMTSSTPPPESAEEAAEVLVQEKKAKKTKPSPLDDFEPLPLLGPSPKEQVLEAIEQKAY